MSIYKQSCDGSIEEAISVCKTRLNEYSPFTVSVQGSLQLFDLLLTSLIDLLSTHGVYIDNISIDDAIAAFVRHILEGVVSIILLN